MPLSKKILFLLCFFSAASSWLVAFPGFEEADLEEESKILESNLSDGPATSTSNTESDPALSSVHPTQTSSSSSMMNSISTTAPGVGTQITEVDLPVKTALTANSRAPFDVPVEKVESPGQSPFGKFQGLTFDIQGHSSVVTGMFIRDLDQEITKYESKIKQLKAGAFSAADSSQAPKTHTELKALEDAFNIIKAGQQYRTHWILQKAQYEKNFGNKKQPPVLSFATALNQEQEILNKNIDKIIDIATRVEELHELKKKWTIACNELKEKGPAQSDRGVLLNVQSNKVQEAINQYLQFAETIRDKDIIEKDNPRKPTLMAAAKEAKETGHVTYYSSLDLEARKQHSDYWRQATEAETQGNVIQAKRYKNAAEAVARAVNQFEYANTAGILEDAQNAYNLSAHYYLQQAEAIIQGNEAEAKRYQDASFAAKAAASQFKQASKAGISEDEKNAWNLSGRSSLQQAEEIVQGNEAEAKRYEAEAKRYDDTALAFRNAAAKFNDANKIGISEDEKNAWNLSAHYYLQQVQAIIQGNEAEAKQCKDAADAANSAANQFNDANKIGISEDGKNARNLSAHYYLQQVQAIIQGNEAKAQRYKDAALAAHSAAIKFNYANKAGISEDEKNAWNLSARYYLQKAQAIIQGNEAEAKQCENVTEAANSAANQFRDANKAEISESQRSYLIQKGKDFLAQAKRLSDQIITEARKQKEAEEQTGFNLKTVMGVRKLM